MTEHQLEQLAKAVHRWLSYQQLCGRSMIFSESYLSQPVAEFMAAHFPGSIVPEFRHPSFTSSKPGRPKQVDFALLSPQTRSVQSVIETKWITSRDYSKQEIVDDLLRLECFRDPRGNYCSRYFLLAGLADHVKAHFENLKYKDVGGKRLFTKRLLSIDRAEPTTRIDVAGESGTFRKLFRAFKASYRVNLPRIFSTDLLARRRLPGDLTVYIWRISSSTHRTTFVPDDEWK